MKQLFFRAVAIAAPALAVATPVFAQGTTTTTPAETTPPATTGPQKPSDFFDTKGELAKSGLPQTSLVDFVLNAVAIFLSVIGIVTLVLIIYAGFLILTSAGNEEKVSQGRQIILWAVVGLIIILGSLGITVFLNRLVA